MNPLVNIQSTSGSVLTNNESDLKQYDLIIAIGLTYRELLDLNARTRLVNIPLIVSQVMGRFGYSLADLLTHQYKR